MRTIMCFGDSNTHGTRAMRHMSDRRRFEPSDRWPDAMASRLGVGWQVLAEGHPGRNAVFDDPIEGEHKNGLRVLPALLESHRPLDLVIVMLGTNDLKTRFSVPASDIAIGLERLVAAIRGSDAGPDRAPPGVLLAAPVPIAETGFLGDMFAGGAAKSRALAPLLTDVAERQGAEFVDLGAVAEVDMTDGIHLSAAAQGAIAQTMARQVRAMFA
ncbi:MAG: SGNH/GDSL hydrolase family protein [Rhodobacteraceae bacterium]|nr:SGNH/GDSL hydrolase family protein [Paracoccaceae bacterium]